EGVKVAPPDVDNAEVAKKVGATDEVDICISVEKLAKQMTLVTKDVDLLTRAIRDNLPKTIEEITATIKAKVKGVQDDIKTIFELMESKMKVAELDMSIKISTAEGNLGIKIDENSSKLTNVEATLAELLKAQQEQNETDKALTDFLVTNFLGDGKKGESSGGAKEQRNASGQPHAKKGEVQGAGGSKV
ncbi:hypothetical protein Dimus_029226, partial [Dionaea muscipula]